MEKFKDIFKRYHNMLSAIIVIIYVLIPVMMMFFRYYNSNNKELLILWYDCTYKLGYIAAGVGIFNLLFNIKKIRIRNMLPFILIAILLTLCYLAASKSIDKEIAFKAEWYRGIGYYAYLLFFSFYLNAINIEKKYYKLIGTIFSLVATSIAVITLLNNDFTYEVFVKGKSPYNGIFFNTNHYGYYLSISVIVTIFLTLYEKNTIKKIIYYLMMTISFIVIIANNTFGSYLGVVVGLLFISIYSIIKKKNIQLIYIVMLFVSLSMMINTSSGSIVKNNFEKLFFDVNVVATSKNQALVDQAGTARMKLWKLTYNKIIKKKPWFGVGPNVVSKIYWNYRMNQGVPHNFLLEVASYNGIPALIVYLLLLLYIFFRNLIKSDKYNIALLTCMASYLTSAFFGNMFLYTSPYFVIVVGMLSSDIIFEDKIKKKIKNPKKKNKKYKYI